MGLKYSPLKDPASCIRHLWLFGAQDFNAPLKCHMFEGTIGSYIAYDALSYTWGDPPSGEYSISVQLNDPSSKSSVLASVDITQSLFEALRHLRRASESRSLWVDALFINQEDSIEKSAQVQMMADIYSKAQQVIGWLGPGNAHCDYAMGYISAIGTEFSQIYDNYSQSLFSTWHQRCSSGWAWQPFLESYRDLGVRSSGTSHGGLLATMSEGLIPPRISGTSTEFFGEEMLFRLRGLEMKLFESLYLECDDTLNRGLRGLWGRKYWTRLWVSRQIP